MKFGLLVDCHVRKDQGQTLAFDELFAQVDAAESMGMDSIWIVEHHFRPQASVLSASMAVAGAIASRTKRVRIGTAVQVLPLGNPPAHSGRGGLHRPHEPRAFRFRRRPEQHPQVL